MDQKLLEAIEKNDICLFRTLVQENEGILQQRTIDTFSTALHLACSYGHLEIVNFLLSRVVGFSGEVELDLILVAISRGYTDIARELLNKWPELAGITDKDGNAPLHHACVKGCQEIASMLLGRETSLAWRRNNSGYTPPHLAAMGGNVSILRDFADKIDSTLLSSLNYEEETLFHLAVKYGHFVASKFLNEFFRGSNVLHCQDRYGNTVLHLAVTGGHHEIADFLINNKELELNTQNSEGLTALDILDRAKDSAEHRLLEAAFLRAGAERRVPPSLEIEETGFQLLSINSQRSSSRIRSSRSKSSSSSSSSSHQLDEDSSRRPTIPKQRRRRKQRDKRVQLHIAQTKRHKEMYTEALQNARNTIILVAILIATVTFAGGINPPGGVYQDGPMKGKSTVGNTTAFKVFAISNKIALLISLAIVMALVSITPSETESLKRLFVIAQKVMWLAVAFMATAYGAATWVILPHSQQTLWLTAVILTVCGGSLGAIFIGLELHSICESTSSIKKSHVCV